MDLELHVIFTLFIKVIHTPKPRELEFPWSQHGGQRKRGEMSVCLLLILFDLIYPNVKKC